MSTNISSCEKNAPYLGHKKAAAEFLAAVSSVTAYHPFRSIGQQIFQGTAVNVTPKALYRGFIWGALSAHQLFLMGSIEGLMRDIFFKKDEVPSFTKKLALGAIAGAFSTITVTPCEMLTVLRQRGVKENRYTLKILYRGTGPLFYRQSGLGAGMLVCPSLVYKQFQDSFPSITEQHARAVKLGTSFLVGASTATLTQVFEQARMMMQNDPEGAVYKNTKMALQKAPALMISGNGYKLFAIRLTTIAIATIVLSTAREIYPKLIFNMENRS